VTLAPASSKRGLFKRHRSDGRAALVRRKKIGGGNRYVWIEKLRRICNNCSDFDPTGLSEPLIAKFAEVIGIKSDCGQLKTIP
jgi:hypothetical protein